MQSATVAGPSCSECESSDIIIKKARKLYCRACWKYHCEFRFRKRLFDFGRPAKGTVGEVFKPADQAVISYDGSPTSVALINLCLNALVYGSNHQNEGVSPNLPFPFKFSIVVILESELNGSPGVEGRQKKHLQSLQKWINYANATSRVDFQFPLLITSLETSLKEFHQEDTVVQFNETPIVMMVSCSEGVTQELEYEPISQLKSTSVDSFPLPINESLDCHLMELRKSLKTKTDDKELVGILKKNLLCDIAAQLKISKVLLPEDQTSLAVKMFSMMSLGRGSQVADEMAFTSTTSTGITLARPLIDFSDDDLRAYLDTLNEQCTDGIVNKGSKRKMKIDSVERQCDDFIVNLQKGYPATVSTLTRIGAKLQSNVTVTASPCKDNEMEACGSFCIFCKSQIDTTSNEDGFCYGCEHFLEDAHPDKKEYFRNLFVLKTS